MSKTGNLRRKIEDQGYRCFFSGEELTPDTFNLDHFTPVKSGGTDDEDNLVFVSPEINQMKGTLEPWRFVELCWKVAMQFISERPEDRLDALNKLGQGYCCNRLNATLKCDGIQKEMLAGAFESAIGGDGGLGEYLDVQLPHVTRKVTPRQIEVIMSLMNHNMNLAATARQLDFAKAGSVRDAIDRCALANGVERAGRTEEVLHRLFCKECCDMPAAV